MLPFHGSARVVVPAAPPGLGPDRVAAVVRAYASRLQVQERLTHQVADAVAAAAGGPGGGVLVAVEAAHMCMVSRGVEQHASATVTLAARGALAGDGGARRGLLAELAAGGGVVA